MSTDSLEAGNLPGLGFEAKDEKALVSVGLVLISLKVSRREKKVFEHNRFSLVNLLEDATTEPSSPSKAALVANRSDFLLANMIVPERSVSVLGLGYMGSALARAFLEKEWTTTVWNRSPARCQPLVTAGAIAAPSADECIRASPLVIACISNSQALHEILENTHSESPNCHILVDYTAGSFSEIGHSEELASTRFSAYIHASIIVTPAFVGLPESISYYSGDESAYRSIESALEVLGRPIYLGPDTGAARFQEILMGGCFYGFAAGFLQTMATLRFSKSYHPGAAQRLMSELIIPLLTDNFPKIFEDLARQVDEKDYVTKGTGVRIDLLIQALEDRIKTYAELGMSTILFHPMLALLKTRLDSGGSGEEEMSSLIEVIANPGKLP